VLIRRSSLKPIEFGRLRIYDYTAAEQWSSSVAVVEVPPGARHSEAWSKRSDKYYLVRARRKGGSHGTGRFLFRPLRSAIQLFERAD
jgi:hypothetical protein